jgi:hypothetical protein
VVETTLKTLIDRFRSKPEWQHADPAVRAEAVLRLPAAEREVLLAIAREDADPRVRRAAVRKIGDVGEVAAIAASDDDDGVKDEAAARLAHLAIHDPAETAGREAVSHLREARHLAAVAKAAPLAGVREAAIRALDDPRALAAIVRETEDPPTRALALSRIEDAPTLLALALKSDNKTVALAAVERLSAEDALRQVAEKARAAAAARRARAKLEPQDLAPAGPPATPRSPASDDAAEHRAYEEARAAQAREVEARAAALAAWTGLAEAVEAAEGEGLAAAVERARAERGSLPVAPASEAAALVARIDGAIAAAEARQAAYAAGLARREALVALAEKAEALAADHAAEHGAFTALEKQWAEATAGADLPDVRARFEAAAATLRERFAAVRAERTQKDQEHLEALTRLAARAEALVAKGVEAPLRDADHVLRDIREAVDHPGHFPTRKDRDAVLARLEAARKQLYPLLQQLREDAEWKRWANVTVQEELCAAMEALAGVEDLEKAAHEMRDLDARWKQAKEAPKEKAEALWVRFKAAREQVRARTDAFFARQSEELAANLAKKETLCEKAEALAESTDWLKTAEELRRLQGEWKEVGPVPRAAAQRIWERFRKPCDRFFTRWQEHRSQRTHEWAENLARKEALCEKAEALRESTEWEAAAAELKRLQAEWRTIGAVKKTRSDAVWQRFRAACDHFFDRYKNRDEHARMAVQAAREEIAAGIEALVPADGAAAEPPADLAERLQAAQAAWRQAGSLPHDELAAFEERFAKARDAVVLAYPAAFAGSDLDPEANRKKAERLLARAEAVLADVSPAATSASVLSAADLAARLRDALAQNTIGGAAAVEAKWQSAGNEIESLQAAWSRLGPLVGDEGRALAERFAKACRRFAEQRPRVERPAYPERPPRRDRGRDRDGGRGPRPGRR